MISQGPSIASPAGVWPQRAHKAGRYLAVATGFILPLSSSLTDACTLLVLVLWFAAGHYKQFWRQVRTHAVIRSSLLLLAVLAIGVLYTSAPWGEALGILKKYRELIFILAFVPFLVEEADRKRALLAFGAAMGVTLLVSFYQVYLAPETQTFRYSQGTPFKSAITHSLFMAMFAFGLITHLVRHRENKKGMAGWGLLLALAVFNLFFMVDGRTGYVIFYLLALLFVIQTFKWRAAALGLAALIALHFLLSSVSGVYQLEWDRLENGIHRYLDTGDVNSSIALRLEFIRNSYEIMMLSPWIGHGTGSFKGKYEEIAEAKKLKHITVNPHNEYLMLGVQAGLVGIGFFLYFLFTLWKCSFALDPYHRNLAQGLALTAAAGCFANSFLLDHTEGALIVFLAAVLYAPLARTREPEPAQRNPLK